MNFFDSIVKGTSKFFPDTTHLRAYYKMENGNDSFGSNNASSLIDVTFDGEAIIKKGGLFSTNSSKMVVSDNASLNINSNLSVSLWFNCQNFSPNGTQGFFIHKASFPYNYRINSEADNGISFFLGVDGVHKFVTTGTKCVENIWYHVVGTYSTSEGLKIYLNGVLNNSNSSATGTTVYTNTTGLYIGGYFGNSNYQVFGTIDEISIWAKNLSPEEVSNLYNNGNGLSLP